MNENQIQLFAKVIGLINEALKTLENAEDTGLFSETTTGADYFGMEEFSNNVSGELQQTMKAIQHFISNANSQLVNN